MAKHNWKDLEKEFILSEFKSVNSFLEAKGITVNGNTKKQTKGWKDKKVLKETKKSTKIVEKVIEKEAEIEAQNIVDIKKLANKLALKIDEASEELNRHLAKNKTKSKTVVYDNTIAKPTKEIINEKETITDYISIIDRQGLKQLTSALKDLNEIILPKQEEPDEDNSFVEALKGKTEEIWDEEE